MDDCPCSPCEQALKRIWDSLDAGKDLDDPEFQAHLARCRQCFEKMQFEKRVWAWIGERCACRTPDGLRDKITELLQRY